MENQYDVGIANRYALFLEEGENELPVIKKKLSKEIRQKNKAIKKENAEARKAEAAKTPEKPKKPEPAPEAIEVSAPKKEAKEEKVDAPKPKEKKPNDVTVNRKDKESQDKSPNVKNGGDAAVDDSWDTPVDAPVPPAPEPVAAEKEFSKPFNENGPPRKTYERRPPRERKFENSDQNQSSRPYSSNQYNRRNNNYNNSNSSNNDNNNGGGGGNNYYNKDDDWDAKNWGDKDGGDGGAAGDNATNRYQNNENRNPRENGVGGPPYTTNEYRPRGGARFRGDSRGGRRNYNGPDRRREYNNDQQQNEQKDESNVFKNDSWGDENTENTTDVPTTDNPKDEETKATENNDASGTDEQKEVKEYLTLDEWKKLQGERQKPQYNLRKAGEGEDLTQWKNMRELEKKKDEEFLEGQNRHEKPNHHEHEKENAGNENVQRVGRKKHIDINVHFRESSSRSRGARIIRNNRFGGGYKGRNEFRGDRDRNERSDRDRNDRSDRDRVDRGDRDRDRNDRDRNDRDRDRDRNDNNTYSGETRSFRKPREPREGGYIGRGGGNRGPPPPPAAVRQNAPKMDDESAFPSLG